MIWSIVQEWLDFGDENPRAFMGWRRLVGRTHPDDMKCHRVHSSIQKVKSMKSLEVYYCGKKMLVLVFGNQNMTTMAIVKKR